MTSRRDKTGDPTYTQTWDYDNRLVSVTGNGQTTTYTYDGNGVLLKKVVGSTTTIYIGNYYEKTGTAVRKYYYFAGQRVAMRDGSTVYFLLTDHLGSSSQVIDQSGSPVDPTLRYYAYGTVRYPTDPSSFPTDYRFTGQRNEQALGLYAMGARWYDGALGRWLSPDTLIPQPEDPQSLNR